MNKFKSKNGITLVALVITIVVLLILAVVALRGVKDERIVDYTDTTRQQVGKAQARQKIETALLEVNTKKNIYGSSTDITKIFNNVQTITEGKKYKVTEDGYEFTIKNSNGEYSIYEYEIKWLTQNNADGTIGITGFDVLEFLENEDYDYLYTSALIFDINVETVNVPSSINGATVTSFSFTGTLDQIWEYNDDRAHSESFQGIKKIILPNTIKECNMSYLVSMPNLEEIILPSNLETITQGYGLYVFDEHRLENLSVPNSVTSISDDIFIGFKRVNFPNGINSALTIPDDLWGADTITVITNGVTTTYTSNK